MTNYVGPFDLAFVPAAGHCAQRFPSTTIQICVTDPAHSYRLYRMDAITGTISRYEDFAAYSDDEAIAGALEEAGDDRIELWRDGRKIVAISGREGPPELTITPPPE